MIHKENVFPYNVPRHRRRVKESFEYIVNVEILIVRFPVYYVRYDLRY